MRTLLDLLGAPDRALRIVTIAGTNGKGSTGAVLESILSHAGRRVGWFAQPHLHTFRERIRIERETIDRDQFGAAVTEVREAVADLLARHPEADEPTTFELTVAIAAVAFARSAIDIAIFEVGLGGRLDPVNALSPCLTILTRIGRDHEALLGSNVGAIAREKVGIARPGVLCLSSPQVTAAMRAIERTTAKIAAPLRLVSPLPVASATDGVARVRPGRSGAHVLLGLTGVHQRENAALAVAAVESLADHGVEIQEDAVAAGLAATRWPGRLEVIAGDPTIILDAAHNPLGASALAHALRSLAPNGYDLVFGCARDKDIGGILRALLPRARAVRLAGADDPRAATATEIVARVAAVNRRQLTAAPDVASALAGAWPDPPRPIVVTGSFRVVAAARVALGLAHECD